MKQARRQANLVIKQWQMFLVRWKTVRLSDSSDPRVWLIWSMLWSFFFCALMAPAASGQTPIKALHVPELEAGFHLLYELKPVKAYAQFEAWQKLHPEDPLGSAAEAAAYLFEESYRQGVLTSDFFLDDKRFLGKVPFKPDSDLRAAFFAADKKAQDLAELQLKTDPDDPNALFAMTLSLGMEADYAALIDKHQLESLKMIRDADKYAKRLLAIAPEGADAYLTLGTANYIIGSLPGIKRFFLGFAGVRGDKKAGIKQLEIAAASGHYLRPFAKIMLALAALREKKPAVARIQLNELVAEFPENTLFASELAKLNVSGPLDDEGRKCLSCIPADVIGLVPISFDLQNTCGKPIPKAAAGTETVRQARPAVWWAATKTSRRCL
jgi:hypothetical protein